MRLPPAIEDPRTRRTRSWVFDVLVALFAGILSIPDLTRHHPVPVAVAVALTVAQAVPLVARRVWPIPVFAVIVAVAAVAAPWDVRLTAGPVLLIALFTIASRVPRRQALIASGVLEVGVIVASAEVEGTDWWYASIFLSGMLAAALGLGLYRGTRRAYLSELHDRAERLERERDQQTALAAAAERARIAGEMHDIVAHHLAVIIALSDGAAAASAASPERAVEVMRTVSATGRRALADTRRLLGVLGEDGDNRRPVPDLAGLDALVSDVRAAGLPVSYEVQGRAAELPAGAQLAVYRLVQEALTNTLKHAGSGASAVVRLRYLDGEVRVDVEDDGAGAPALPMIGSGRGLAGMRERVNAYGGRVDSGPRRPSGWRVSASLRVDDRAST
jgi:signal transduction histidine kinase